VKYTVVVSPAAEKFTLRLPLQDYEPIRGAISSLSDNPRPIQSRTLVNTELLRLRVRRYRIIYSVDNETKIVYIERIALRNEKTYRRL
jgi:mRNA interferase RelE/StbE